MKILIPTDAGLLGDYAYSVAERLASKIDVEIYYLSIIPAPGNVVFNADGSFIDDNELDYTILYDQQKRQTQKVIEWSAKKQVKGKVKVQIGNIDNSILAYSNQIEADLIIMGTSGVFSFTDTIHGSHTEYITSHAQVPVISLKCERSGMNLDELVFLSDFKSTDTIEMDIVKSIASNFNTTIVLLQVVFSKVEEQRVEIEAKMHEFAKNNHLENYRVAVYEDTTVAKGVSRFCEENNIDLISIGTHQRHGLLSMFQQHISKDLVNHIFHPVLTFPI